MEDHAPLSLALVVFDASDFPDTDSAQRFVESEPFGYLSDLAEYGLYKYRDGEVRGPLTELVRDAAAHLLLDLEAIRRAAGSPVPRRLEPASFPRETGDAMVWPRAVLAELAVNRFDGAATRYLLGLFDRVRAPIPGGTAKL